MILHGIVHQNGVTKHFGQFTDKNNIKFSQMNNNSYCSELKLDITMEIVFV